jgi:hypothetical protein
VQLWEDRYLPRDGWPAVLPRMACGDIIEIIKGEMQFDRHADEALRILKEHRTTA